MKLMTEEIEKKAQEQYPFGSDFSQMIVAKFFNPLSNWSWFLMNQDPADPDYLWGIVEGFEIEVGSFSLSDLQSHKGALGLGIERDLHFTPITAQECWEKLRKGDHV